MGKALRKRLSWFHGNGNGQEFAFLFLVVAMGFFLQSRTAADADLWGHVKFGQDILRTGIIVHPDSYSYLSEFQPWINHEWLSEVTFGFMYNLWGVPGLILLKSSIFLLLMGVIWFRLRREGIGTLLVLIMFIFLMLPWVTSIRPQIFTYLFFSLVLLVIHGVERGRIRWVWALPFIMVFWVNFHGGFLAGVGVVVLWAALHLISLLVRERRLAILKSASALAIWISVGFCLLATLLNPYGAALPGFILNTALIPRPEISEWVPIAIRSPSGMGYLVSLVITLASVLYSRRDKNPVLMLMMAFIALLPLLSFRHAPLYALAMAIFSGEHIGDSWKRFWKDGGGSLGLRLNRHQPQSAMFPILIVVSSIVLVGLSIPNLGCARINPNRAAGYPARAIDFLSRSGGSGNLITHFEWGEYAIWHLSPRFKVSMDGRRRTVYSKEIYREYVNFIHGLGDWDAHLRRKKADFALIPKAFPVYNLMKLKPGWTLVYEDPLGAIFVAEDSAFLEGIRNLEPSEIPHDGAGMCFP